MFIVYEQQIVLFLFMGLLQSGLFFVFLQIKFYYALFIKIFLKCQTIR